MESTQNLKTPAQTFEFSNERDAVRFAKAHHGPINIKIERVARGRWLVEISDK